MKCAVVPVTPLQQNCSILICEETNKAAVVDPGGEIEKIVDALVQLNVELEKVFLTHGHLDHCSAADEIRKRFQVPIEGPQLEDKFWIDMLPESCAEYGLPIVEAFDPDRWLEDGDRIQFGNQSLSVKHCPGHTPGHVIFYHEGVKLAIVGDVLFQGSIGRSDFPRGDFDTLISSIREKLWPLGNDVTFLPGHGPTSTFGQERQNNSFVADRLFS